VVEHVQKIQSHPSVYVCAPPPMYVSRLDADDERVTTRLHATVADVAHHTGAHFVDLFECLGGARLERPDAFFAGSALADWQKQKQKQKSVSNAPYDGVHPNAVGNALIADTLAEAIVKQLHLAQDLYRCVFVCWQPPPESARDTHLTPSIPGQDVRAPHRARRPQLDRGHPRPHPRREESAQNRRLLRAHRDQHQHWRWRRGPCGASGHRLRGGFHHRGRGVSFGRQRRNGHHELPRDPPAHARVPPLPGASLSIPLPCPLST
jgi:hypothetical protein